MTLTIYFSKSQPETLRNIKTKERALEIVHTRKNVRYAVFDKKVIFGIAPQKPKHPREMSLQELEARIRMLG